MTFIKRFAHPDALRASVLAPVWAGLLGAATLMGASVTHADHAPREAHEAAQGARLERVEVRTEAADTSLSATAADKLEPFFRASRAQALLDGEQWREGHAASQEDLFKRVPGVWVTNQNGGDDVRLAIRGSGISSNSFGRGVRSYQDGVPLGSLDGGTTNQLLDLLAYDHAEIYRGPAGLALGAATTGGVINYASRTGRNTPGWLLRSEAGSFGYRRNQIAHGGAAGDVDHFVSLNHSYLDGFRDQSRQNALRFNSNVGFRLRDDIENRTYLFLTDAQLQLPGAIPLDQLNRDTRRDAAAFNRQFDADRNWQDARFANRTLWQIDAQRSLTTSFFLNRGRLDHLPTPFVGIIDNRVESHGLSVDYNATDSAGHSLVAGVRAGQGSDDLARFQQTTDGQRKGNQTFDARLRTLQLEAYAERGWQVSPRWRVNLGAQALHSRRVFDDFQRDVPPPCPDCAPFPQPSADPDDNSYTVTYRGVSPKLGATFEWVPGQMAFVQLARSIEGPSSSELGNNPEPAALDQQDAVTAEIGTRGVLEWGYWDLVLYQTRIDNEILNLDLDGASGTFNARGETRRYGVEFGGGVHLADSLLRGGDSVMLTAVYNWSDFRFDDDPDFGNSRLPTIPQHTVFASLRYSTVDGLVIAPNMRYVSGYELTYNNDGGRLWRAPSHTLWGLTVSKAFANGLRLFVDGHNLTDEVYVATGSPTVAANPMSSAAAITPGAPRAWYAGVEYRY